MTVWRHWSEVTRHRSERRSDVELHPQSQQSTDCHSVTSVTPVAHLHTEHTTNCMSWSSITISTTEYHYCNCERTYNVHVNINVHFDEINTGPNSKKDIFVRSARLYPWKSDLCHYICMIVTEHSCGLIVFEMSGRLWVD